MQKVKLRTITKSILEQVEEFKNIKSQARKQIFLNNCEALGYVNSAGTKIILLKMEDSIDILRKVTIMEPFVKDAVPNLFGIRDANLEERAYHIVRNACEQSKQIFV